jgi:nucleoid DNA-binding protein
MNKTELIEALSNEIGLAPGKAEQVARMAFNSMAKGLVDGARIEVEGLVRFLSTNMMDTWVEN